MQLATLATVLLLLPVLCACGASQSGGTPSSSSPSSNSSSATSSSATSSATSSGAADHIVVDHILIGVKNPSFPDGKRNAAEARLFAKGLFAKLKAGEDWAQAKQANSEDPPPGGPYGMANRGVAAAPGEHRRDGMVPAFGDVGFTLAVGEIGLADYDARTSPFGYHIIKRVK